jgi:hypothetical protein
MEERYGSDERGTDDDESIWNCRRVAGILLGEKEMVAGADAGRTIFVRRPDHFGAEFGGRSFYLHAFLR